ncbi:hypothetical protein [Adhaeribacter terreus]|uniref:Uncharacterized protein n=1 Tax=Adhaeribacter terreus TaxID=529703 RepID=A0ABW0ED97_9BACT
MESVQIQGPNILKMLFGGISKTPAADFKTVVCTTDGDLISQGAMDAAVRNGKGVMIGGFFVGSTHTSDLDFGYSLSI